MLWKAPILATSPTQYRRRANKRASALPQCKQQRIKPCSPSGERMAFCLPWRLSCMLINRVRISRAHLQGASPAHARSFSGLKPESAPASFVVRGGGENTVTRATTTAFVGRVSQPGDKNREKPRQRGMDAAISLFYLKKIFLRVNITGLSVFLHCRRVIYSHCIFCAFLLISLVYNVQANQVNRRIAIDGALFIRFAGMESWGSVVIRFKLKF